MRFAQLTDSRGGSVYIDPDEVAAVESLDAETKSRVVVLKSGHWLKIADGPDLFERLRVFSAREDVGNRDEPCQNPQHQDD